ncbi:DUF2752 domain-containing protein [Actinoplanes sp. N902-109]|uniref:DUF2752 domain-containing protein n=1 Tax=Actinoplanes sp. (strain N902-109) TaxID=649831 RepID=UPI0003296786|nr:DUF2752 domain-containing protein [Actinoplanes sp. N902-109]AGL20299.1 hypothetical protein L083_6789 [Actinoplanes sp. N902-109]
MTSTAGAVASEQQPDPAPYGAPYAGYPDLPEARSDRFARFLQTKWHRSPLWVAPAAMLVCMGGAVGYTLATHPASADAGAAPTCLLKYTTGFVCPGCGGTRAAWFLLHGDIPDAARHHALFVFAVPFLIYMYVAWSLKRVFGWDVPQLNPSPAVLGTFMAAWGVFSVLRNLPWAPFTSLYV